MPVYNRAEFLPDVLESVFDQSFSDFELIVVDDGSTDGTAEVLRRFADRIVILTEKQNSGAAQARNLAASKAQGSWLAFLDSDDVWTKDSLAARAKLLEDDAGFGLLFGDATIEKQRGKTGGLVSDRRKPHQGQVTEKLFFENFLCTSTVMIKRETFNHAGGFRQSHQPAEDYDLWLRLAPKVRFKYYNQPVASYRVHTGSIGADRARMFEAEIKTLNDHLDRLGRDYRPLNWRKRMASLHFFTGLLELDAAPTAARMHFSKAAQLEPLVIKNWIFLAASYKPTLLAGPTRRFLNELELF